MKALLSIKQSQFLGKNNSTNNEVSNIQENNSTNNEVSNIQENNSTIEERILKIAGDNPLVATSIFNFPEGNSIEDKLNLYYQSKIYEYFSEKVEKFIDDNIKTDENTEKFLTLIAEYLDQEKYMTESKFKSHFIQIFDFRLLKICPTKDNGIIMICSICPFVKEMYFDKLINKKTLICGGPLLKCYQNSILEKSAKGDIYEKLFKIYLQLNQKNKNNLTSLIFVINIKTWIVGISEFHDIWSFKSVSKDNNLKLHYTKFLETYKGSDLSFIFAPNLSNERFFDLLLLTNTKTEDKNQFSMVFFQITISHSHNVFNTNLTEHRIHGQKLIKEFTDLGFNINGFYVYYVQGNINFFIFR
jgi:hypothetical protein